jgi:hypothetical protein
VKNKPNIESALPLNSEMVPVAAKDAVIFKAWIDGAPSYLVRADEKDPRITSSSVIWRKQS